MLWNLFLDANWLDCNVNLLMGNLDPLVQILQLRYYENSSHSLQNTKIAYLEHFICSAHNYNFIQIKTTCILYLACWKPPSPFSNVHFRNTTKILQHKFFTLKLFFIFTLNLLKVSFLQTMSLSCIFVFAPSFIRMDLSIMSTSTSLTFSEFLVLFSSISLLFSFIESHFALSSARCHL